MMPEAAPGAANPPGGDPRTPARARTPGARFRGIRAFLTLVESLFFAVAMDVSLRCIVLPWFRNDEGKRISAVAKIGRLWGIATWWTGKVLLGLRVVVEGDTASTRRCIIVTNHQSTLDIPLLLYLFRGLDLKFTAKDELEHGKPGVSLALRTSGSTFVRKRTLGADLAELQRFGARMERIRGTPVVFAEGMRSPDGSPLPFDFAGAEVIRRASRLPLLPVTLDGLWKARTIWTMGEIAGGTIRVRVGKPVPAEDVDRDPRRAYRAIEEEIRGNLAEMRGARPASGTFERDPEDAARAAGTVAP